MTRRLSTIIGLAFIALLATLAAQEPLQSSGSIFFYEHKGPRPVATLTERSLRVDAPSPSIRTLSIAKEWDCARYSPNHGWLCQDSAQRPRHLDAPVTQLKTASGGQGTTPMLQWQTECNCLSADSCCSQDTAISTAGTANITITAGPTTLAAPGLKVYTTYLGLPCGDAFPMVGCLPPEMQGWLVQIEGGDAPHFDVTLVYTDAEGRRHAHAQECVPRGESYQGKPPFTAVPFRTGRAKMPPWFPEGSTVIRTEVWPSKPGCEVRP